MSTITIGSETRPLAEADAEWIVRQINGRRRDVGHVCVTVSLAVSGVNIGLATPACNSGGGSIRTLNPLEREIVELWKKLGLNGDDFSPGNVVAFVKQVSQRL